MSKYVSKKILLNNIIVPEGTTILYGLWTIKSEDGTIIKDREKDTVNKISKTFTDVFEIGKSYIIVLELVNNTGPTVKTEPLKIKIEDTEATYVLTPMPSVVDIPVLTPSHPVDNIPENGFYVTGSDIKVSGNATHRYSNMWVTDEYNNLVTHNFEIYDNKQKFTMPEEVSLDSTKLYTMHVIYVASNGDASGAASIQFKVKYNPYKKLPLKLIDGYTSDTVDSNTVPELKEVYRGFSFATRPVLIAPFKLDIKKVEYECMDDKGTKLFSGVSSTGVVYFNKKFDFNLINPAGKYSNVLNRLDLVYSRVDEFSYTRIDDTIYTAPSLLGTALVSYNLKTGRFRVYEYMTNFRFVARPFKHKGKVVYLCVSPGKNTPNAEIDLETGQCNMNLEKYRRLTSYTWYPISMGEFIFYGVDDKKIHTSIGIVDLPSSIVAQYEDKAYMIRIGDNLYVMNRTISVGILCIKFKDLDKTYTDINKYIVSIEEIRINGFALPTYQPTFVSRSKTFYYNNRFYIWSVVSGILMLDSTGVLKVLIKRDRSVNRVGDMIKIDNYLYLGTLQMGKHHKINLDNGTVVETVINDHTKPYLTSFKHNGELYTTSFGLHRQRISKLIDNKLLEIGDYINVYNRINDPILNTDRDDDRQYTIERIEPIGSSLYLFSTYIPDGTVTIGKFDLNQIEDTLAVIPKTATHLNFNVKISVDDVVLPWKSVRIKLKDFMIPVNRIDKSVVYNNILENKPLVIGNYIENTFQNNIMGSTYQLYDGDIVMLKDNYALGRYNLSGDKLEYKEDFTVENLRIASIYNQFVLRAFDNGHMILIITDEGVKLHHIRFNPNRNKLYTLVRTYDLSSYKIPVYTEIHYSKLGDKEHVVISLDRELGDGTDVYKLEFTPSRLSLMGLTVNDELMNANLIKQDDKQIFLRAGTPMMDRSITKDISSSFKRVVSQGDYNIDISKFIGDVDAYNPDAYVLVNDELWLMPKNTDHILRYNVFNNTVKRTPIPYNNIIYVSRYEEYIGMVSEIDNKFIVYNIEKNPFVKTYERSLPKNMRDMKMYYIGRQLVYIDIANTLYVYDVYNGGLVSTLTTENVLNVVRHTSSICILTKNKLTKIGRLADNRPEIIDLDEIVDYETIGVNLDYYDSVFLPRDGGNKYIGISIFLDSHMGSFTYGTMLASPIVINREVIYFITDDNKLHRIGPTDYVEQPNRVMEHSSEDIGMTISNISELKFTRYRNILVLPKTPSNMAYVIHPGNNKANYSFTIDSNRVQMIDDMFYLPVIDMYVKIDLNNKKLITLNINTNATDINRGKDVYKLPVPNIEINSKYQSKLFKNVYLQNNKQLLLNTDRLEVDPNASSTNIATLRGAVDTSRLTNEYGLMVNEKYIYYPGKKTGTSDWYLHKYNIELNKARILPYKLLTDIPFASNPTGDMYRVDVTDALPILSNIEIGKMTYIDIHDDSELASKDVPFTTSGKQLTVNNNAHTEYLMVYLEDSKDIKMYKVGVVKNGLIATKIDTDKLYYSFHNRHRFAVYSTNRLVYYTRFRSNNDIMNDLNSHGNGKYSDSYLSLTTYPPKDITWHPESSLTTPARDASDALCIMCDDKTGNIKLCSKQSRNYTTIDMTTLNNKSVYRGDIENKSTEPLDPTQWVNPLNIVINTFNVYFFYRNGDMLVMFHNGSVIKKVARYHHPELKQVTRMCKYNNDMGTMYFGFTGISKIGKLNLSIDKLEFINSDTNIIISNISTITPRYNRPTELLLIGQSGVFLLNTDADKITNIDNISFSSTIDPIVLHNKQATRLINGPDKKQLNIRVNKKLDLDRITHVASSDCDIYNSFYLSNRSLIINSYSDTLLYHDTNGPITSYMHSHSRYIDNEFKIHNSKKLLNIGTEVIPRVDRKASNNDNILLQFVHVDNEFNILADTKTNAKETVFEFIYYSKADKHVYVMSNKVEAKKIVTAIVSSSTVLSINDEDTNYLLREYFTVDNKIAYRLDVKSSGGLLELYEDKDPNTIDYKKLTSVVKSTSTSVSGSQLTFYPSLDTVTRNDDYVVLGLKSVQISSTSIPCFIVIDRKASKWRLLELKENSPLGTYSGHSDIYDASKLDRHLGDIVHTISLNDNKFILIGKTGVIAHIKINTIENIDVKTAGDSTIVSKLTVSYADIKPEYIHDITIDDKVYLSVFQEAGMHVIDRNTGDITYVPNNDITYAEDKEKGTRSNMVKSPISKNEILINTAKGITIFNYVTNKFKYPNFETDKYYTFKYLSLAGLLLINSDKSVYASLPYSSLALKYQLGSVREYIDKGLPLPNPDDPRYMLGTDVETFKKSRAIVCTGFDQNTATYDTNAIKNANITPGERYEFCIYLANGKRIFLSTVNQTPRALIYK